VSNSSTAKKSGIKNIFNT